ncbi:MAG: HIT family protein [Myxococcales bacterium]|nr:HIT family protein [Myxococcales bacterium]MBK7197879.1 HIT family protein [Myxococcales bacterium]MBP6848194.1 HIT family protein [Kofleriaceae bacterium]
MPTLISRDEALARIRAEGGAPPCLMCAIRDRQVGATYAVHEDDDILVLLPRYVRRWGHVVVMPRAHVVTYTGVTPALWARINADALHAAKMLERIRQPLRVYVTSTGSSAGELTQTSMHLHVHVIPLYDDHDRPADVFSWQGGVWVGEPDEWHALRDEYAAAWRAAVTAQA